MKNKTYIYFAERLPQDGAIKIGRSVNPSNRINQLKKEHGCDFRVLGFICESLGMTENIIHRHFSKIRIRYEWFESAPVLREFICKWASPELSGALPDSYIELD